jgi:hypothetical protein
MRTAGTAKFLESKKVRIYKSPLSLKVLKESRLVRFRDTFS